MAGASHPGPMPEPVGTWFFKRNTWAEHNLGNPSRSKGAVTEIYAVVGCSDHFEFDFDWGQPVVPGLRRGAGTDLLPGKGCGASQILPLRDTRAERGELAPG